MTIIGPDTSLSALAQEMEKRALSVLSLIRADAGGYLCLARSTTLTPTPFIVAEHAELHGVFEALLATYDTVQPHPLATPCAQSSEPRVSPGCERDAAEAAFDAIAKAVGVPSWDYPGQLVRDVEALAKEAVRLAERNQARARTLHNVLEERNALRLALAPLVAIADAYDANSLDDEARKHWGITHINNAGREVFQNTNTTPPDQIELYTGRGGAQLLTLAHCLQAREVLRRGKKDEETYEVWQGPPKPPEKREEV